MDQPVFSWTAVPHASYYEIEVALDDQFVTITDPGNKKPPRVVYGTTYVPTFTYNAKTHYWRVRAIAADNEVSAWSSTAEFTRRWTNSDEAAGVQTDFPASRVQGVRLLNHISAPPLDDIAITWDPVPGAAYYEVEIGATNGEEPLICRTPHNVLAPNFDGSYLLRSALSVCTDVVSPLREWTSASAWSQPSPGVLEIEAADVEAGDGVYVRFLNDTEDTTVVEPFFARVQAVGGDPASMRILGAAPSDPDSVAQYFKTGLPIEAGETYFARVRAVDEPTTGDYPATPVYSMWSNERREAYEPPGSYLFFTPTDPTPGTGSSLAPVIPRDADVAGTDVPVLRWRPLSGADAYRVVIALDRDFTDRVATYWTRNTVFVPPEVYDDNGPNGKYHWFAGPCWYTSVEEQEVECLAAEDYAINDPRYVGRFSKKSAPIADLQHSAIDDGTNVLLRWADALTAAKAKPSAQTPGGVSAYEVQMSDGDWKNAVSITTDNLAYSTSLKTLAPATYQWRVRPLDGQKVPLAWSYGAPFTIVRGPLYTPPRPTKRSPKLIPGRPGKPRVRAVTRRKLRVAWRHSEAFGAAVRTYKVYRSVNAGPYRRVAATSKAKLRLRAKRGKVYRFYIVADSNAGPGKRSATTRFRMPWRA